MARVLVIEDDPALRDLYAEAIRDLGQDVDVASDGVDALRQLKRDRPDAIVLDLMLPQVSGYEVLQFVRSSAELRSTPVIVISATATGHWALQVGASAYLAKPFEFEKLAAILRQVIH
jgi:twitching motility two-component system response regulator PilH